MLYIKEQTSINTIYGTTINRPETILSKRDNMRDAIIELDNWVSEMNYLFWEVGTGVSRHENTVEYDASYGHVMTRFYITD